jgi:hypothetical protein
MLEQCVELFDHLDEPALSGALQEAMQLPPLETPADHAGPPATHMFQLNLNVVQRQTALDLVQRAVAGGLTTRGTGGRGLGGFAEAWREYLSYRA